MPRDLEFWPPQIIHDLSARQALSLPSFEMSCGGRVSGTHRLRPTLPYSRGIMECTQCHKFKRIACLPFLKKKGEVCFARRGSNIYSTASGPDFLGLSTQWSAHGAKKSTNKMPYAGRFLLEGNAACSGRV